MNMKKSIFVLAAVTTGLLSLYSQNVMAEGSVDMVKVPKDVNVNDQAYRPFTEWSGESQLGQRRQTVIHVYAKEGETIYFGSSNFAKDISSIESIWWNEIPTATPAATAAPTPTAVANEAAAQAEDDETGDNTESDSTPSPTPSPTPKPTAPPYQPAFADKIPENCIQKDVEKWEQRTKGVGVAVTIPQNVSGEETTPDKNNIVLVDGTAPDFTGAADGTTYLFMIDSASETQAGYIKDVENETAGPKIKDLNEEGGYTPLSFTAPKTGTYTFRFLSENTGILTWDDDIKGFKTHYQNPQGTTAVGATWWDKQTNKAKYGNVASFDVTVVGNKETATDNNGTSTVANDDDDETETPSTPVQKEIKLGRVWSDTLFLNTGGGSGIGMYSEFYILTDTGYEYKLSTNGIEPFGFMFYANNRGPLWDPNNIYTNDSSKLSNLQSLMHSFSAVVDKADVPLPTVNEGYVYLNNQPVDSDLDKTHKIFFNQPDSDALSAYTNTEDGKLAKPLSETGSVSINYKGEGPETATTAGDSSDKTYQPITGQYGTEGFGGTFTITLGPNVNAPESFTVKLDFSDYVLWGNDEKSNYIKLNNEHTDRTWKKHGEETITNEHIDAEQNNIVTLTSVKKTENGQITYTMYWDGRDAYNNIVPQGTYDKITVTAAGGTVHIPLLDVEKNPNGIKLQRMNDTEKNDSTYKIYYNNVIETETGDGETKTISSVGDKENASQGVSSATGAMAYGIKYEDPEKEDPRNGDNCLLDIWTEYSATPLNIKLTVLAALDPYLSFVKENGTGGSGLLEKSKIQYQGMNRTRYEDNNSGTGNAEYGNSISTGFFTTLDCNENTTYQNVVWQIDIPSTRLFVKIPADKADSTPSLGGKELVLKKNPVYAVDNAVKNPGAIYQADGFEGGLRQVTVKLKENTPAISGNGSVMFGIVLDNIYAMDAKAKLLTDEEGPVTQIKEVPVNNYGEFEESGYGDYENQSSDNKTEVK